MDKKVISIKKYQKNKFKEQPMLFIIILLCVIVASLFWKFYIEDQEILEAQIPESQNIVYNSNAPEAVDPANIADQIQTSSGGPVLIYFYTTWCGSCVKNFPIFNEIAREFQNTDLKVISVAIDSNIDQDKISQFLASKGDIYFKPQFLASRNGFEDLLREFKIKYTGRIPFTTVLSGQGKVLLKYSGSKSDRKLRLVIRKELLED